MGYIGNSNYWPSSLGGNLDVNGKQITSSTNGNIQIIPHGSGTVTIDALTFPTSDGSANQILKTNGSGVLSWADDGVGTTGIANTNTVVVDDADAADNDYVRFTSSGVEGRSYAEVKTDLSLNNVENTAISTWAGSSNVTTIGTVTSGTISTGAVLADVTMTLGSDADGDIYYRSSNKLTRLAKGSASQVLTMNSGATAPEWAASSGGGGMSGSKLTITAASAPSDPSSGNAFIYSTQTSGDTGIQIHASGSSEVLRVRSGSSSTNLLYLNNQGNLELSGACEASYFHDSGAGFYSLDPGSTSTSIEIAGDIHMKGSNKELRFYESSNYVGFEAPALTGDQIWVLPAADGSAGQFLKTDGSGNLSFAAAGGGGGASEYDDLSDSFHDGYGCLSTGFECLNDTNDDGTSEGTSNVSIAFGYKCLKNQTGSSAYDNVAIGRNCLEPKTTNGQGNVAIGRKAGALNTSGFGNVALGYYAGFLNTSGGSNIAFGYGALWDNQTGSNNVGIGQKAGRSTSPSGAITGSNIICLGNNSITDIYCADTTISSSDQRDKTDVADFTHGLDFVKKLKPKTYKWDKRAWYTDEQGDDLTKITPDGTYKAPRTNLGFMAQEVLALEKEIGYGNSKNDMLFCSINEDETAYGLKYERLVPLLVNAIKELSDEVDKLKGS